jgi:hypothetical protein
MATKKWFYPAQKRIAEYMTQKYGEQYRCNWQDVTKNRVHENYTLVNCPTPGNTFVLHFIIYRQTNKKETGLIAIYNRGDADYLTYDLVK